MTEEEEAYIRTINKPWSKEAWEWHVRNDRAIEDRNKSTAFACMVAFAALIMAMVWHEQEGKRRVEACQAYVASAMSEAQQEAAMEACPEE